MKVPASLVTPDDEIFSYGELKSYLRAVRYDTAKRWVAVWRKDSKSESNANASSQSGAKL